MSFLRAEWRKLIFVNYKIDVALLADYIPLGTEIDLWQGDCYLSLIGFSFINTRLLGVKVPFHVNFEEVNLRFYVKRLDKGEWKRGVVFIKEIVPKPALTFIANTFYKEKYVTLPMASKVERNPNHLHVQYTWKKASKTNLISVNSAAERSEMLEGSEEEFITEHYWGYSKVGPKKTFEYEVRHPRWEIYQVHEHYVDVDFGSTYGQNFDFLGSQKPNSVFMAEGSEISVESKKVIRL